MEQLITLVNNNPMLSAVWLALIVMIIFITIKMKLSPVKQLSTQELILLVNKSDG